MGRTVVVLGCCVRLSVLGCWGPVRIMTMRDVMRGGGRRLFTVRNLTVRSECTLCTLRTLCTPRIEPFFPVKRQVHEPEHVGRREERRQHADAPQELMTVQERLEQ